MKILFAKANMLCHDINTFTKSQNHIDVVMGASTGDIVWFEAFSQKYVRINKNVSHPPYLSIIAILNISRALSPPPQSPPFAGSPALKTSS